MAHLDLIDSNGNFDDPRVIAARQTFAKYGALAAPPDVYSHDRWMMASLHAIIFNSLEAVYKNSTRIAHNDLANFLPVARDTFLFLSHHHDLEETLYFPALESAGVKMESNRVQHSEFVPIIDEALAYVDSVDVRTTPRPAPFDAYKLRSLIDRLLLPAAVHMVDELDTLSPERIKEHNAVDGAKAGRAAVDASIKKNDNIVIAVPRMLYNRLPGCGFPDMVPGFVLRILAPVFSWMHMGRRKYFWAMKRWESVPVNEEWRQAEKE